MDPFPPLKTLLLLSSLSFSSRARSFIVGGRMNYPADERDNSTDTEAREATKRGCSDGSNSPSSRLALTDGGLLS
jgi:hypothetical protein